MAGREPFNEDSLRADIAAMWGEHGAHIDVFDHMNKLARFAVAYEQDIKRLKLLLVDCAEFLECIDFYEEGRTPPISLDDLAARLRKELEG